MGESLKCKCCIAGGGPAGMMLGLLLARAGIDVIVLEKHADFFRDFRGDTIHPSTLELMHELGVLDEFLRIGHDEVHKAQITLTGEQLIAADFSRLPTKCKFIAFMPQWDFLDFIASQAKRYSSFHLRMSSTVSELLFEGEKVVGVVTEEGGTRVEIRADLVIGADGRHSAVRELAGMYVTDFGVPIDVLWSKIPKSTADKQQSLGHINEASILVLIDRADYYQCGYVVRKGSFEAIKSAGLPAFRAAIRRSAPFIGDNVEALDDWEKVKLLTVKIDRLSKWYRDGLLCIGDAAHAMSPAGGVGVNLAIQDAVATSNLLAGKLKGGRVAVSDLAAVQERRMFPTKMTQMMQIFIHRRMFSEAPTRIKLLPIMKWLLRNVPAIRHLNARTMGLGFRSEHLAKIELPGTGASKS